MLLKKSTSERALKYQVNYENENARLLIADAVRNGGAVINVFDGFEISEELAFFVWTYAQRDKILHVTFGDPDKARMAG